MPATVIAERIGWEHFLTTLKDRVRQIRPEYQGIGPAARITYEPGQLHPMRSMVPGGVEPGCSGAGSNPAYVGDDVGVLAVHDRIDSKTDGGC